MLFKPGTHARPCQVHDPPGQHGSPVFPKMPSLANMLLMTLVAEPTLFATSAATGALLLQQAKLGKATAGCLSSCMSFLGCDKWQECAQQAWTFLAEHHESC